MSPPLVPFLPPWEGLCSGIGGNTGSCFLFQKGIVHQFNPESLSHVSLSLVSHRFPDFCCIYSNPIMSLLWYFHGLVCWGVARPVAV